MTDNYLIPWRRSLAICILLVIATLAGYWQVRHHDFINYDDPEYVTKNPHVRAGFAREGIVRAFTTRRDANWFPFQSKQQNGDGRNRYGTR